MFETSENLPRYFKSIQHEQPLSLEQEAALAVRIKAGDHSAVHELVQHNLKIVVTIANRHIGQGVALDDLIQEGNIGLYEAANRFDPREGVRFIAYASLWIRKRINEAVGNYGRIVRLPQNQEYEIYLAKRAGEDVPSRKSVQLDAEVSDDSDTTLGDLLLAQEAEAEFSIEIDHLQFTARRAMRELKPRDRAIVAEYFGIGRDCAVPTDVIAERFDMTNVRICQIVKSSIEKMRESL